MQQMTKTIHELIAAGDVLRRQVDALRVLQNRVVLLETRAATEGGGGGGHGYEDRRDLVDKRFFTPEPLVGKDIFRAWAEDFTDYIRSRDVDMASLLDSCKYSDI